VVGVSDMISGPRRPVGVRDVAAAAGVSRQTVSRVLNEHPDVAEATKERVLAAMSDLGYRMNNAARALGTKRTRTIGVVASDALEYGPSRSIAAIEASARAAGFWVSAAFADSGDADSVRSAVAHLQAQSVDGLIVFAPHASALDVLDGIDVGVPVAVLHAGGRGESGLSVDQVTGARLAVRALLDAGHRQIAHVAGPAEWMEASARTAGVVAELDAHGLRPVVIVDGDWTAGSGHRAAAAVADSGATAVFASNDQMALGLIGGLRERGLRVPEDVSVVGFDDTPDAAFFWPALTTVRQDFEELARRAVAAVTGEGLVPSEPVEPVLIERASVQPPRHADGIAR
jgi:DNA-binding LacI/PurR family transcriptional regulator